MQSLMIILLTLASFGRLLSEVKLNGLFCDHAVLQQQAEVPIWGRAKEGESVSVEIDGKKSTTIAQGGNWILFVKNLKAGGSYTLTVTGENKLMIHDIMVGEVWLCSGQSNMERPIGSGLRGWKEPSEKYEEVAAAANYPQIRHFSVPQITS